MEEVNAGLVHDADEVYTEYEDLHDGPWQHLVLRVLKRIPVRRLHEQTGMSPSQLKAIRNGHGLPRAAHREALIRAAAEFARAQLRAAGRAAPAGDLETCAAHHMLVASQQDTEIKADN